RDERRLALGRDADAFELGGRRGERGPAGIVRSAGQRQRRRLDHDRRPPTSTCERGERLAGEWEAERVADRGLHVVEGLARRGRPKDDRVVRGVDDDHAAARQKGQFQARKRATGSGRLTGRRLAEMSPKTLTGAELQLDDAPARECDLFLVDGNNLAYRAFFALPEELATSEGFSHNALLGFSNMLFKLLSDYRPKGVPVAWDTRPVHRTELSEEYKSE